MIHCMATVDSTLPLYRINKTSTMNDDFLIILVTVRAKLNEEDGGCGDFNQ